MNCSGFPNGSFVLISYQDMAQYLFRTVDDIFAAVNKNNVEELKTYLCEKLDSVAEYKNRTGLEYQLGAKAVIYNETNVDHVGSKES